MSKQSEAKAAQGYQDKPEKRQCSMCRHFTSEQVTLKCGIMLTEWTEDRNLRCNLGGFKVKKTAVCNIFERKDEPSS